MVQLALLFANGSVVTSNISSYGSFTADIYTTTNTSNSSLFTLKSSRNLVACVGQPGYWCYDPTVDENSINSTTTTAGAATNVLLSWKQCVG